MGKSLMKLTTNLQLCLAHYCDIHGPTPLMVTEGFPASCNVCQTTPKDLGPLANSTSPTPTPAHRPQEPEAALARAVQNLKLGDTLLPTQANTQATSVSRAEAITGPPHQPPHTSSNVDTPPESPRPLFQPSRRDSSYRRTYDETVTKKQGPCDNCAMTLPRRQKSGKADNQLDTLTGPTLRTRAPAEQIFGNTGVTSPPRSQASSDNEAEKQEAPSSPTAYKSPRRKTTAQTGRDSSTASCSSDSTVSDRHPFHVHYLNYTSTHEPVIANSFTLLRAACLRALSFETLPRAPATAQSPTSSVGPAPPSFVTTQSAGSAGSGGTIFFGDSNTGYTTAYIFRIPDIHARGHKRVYAFLALSTQKERLAMKAFAFVSHAFEELALYIQQLAEAEADRVAESTSAVPAAWQHQQQQQGNGAYMMAQRTTTIQAAAPTAVDRSESSFLTGGSAFTRRMRGGGLSSAPKARGLAELVGQSDFFIDLHRRFVQLLLEVGVTLSA